MALVKVLIPPAKEMDDAWCMEMTGMLRVAGGDGRCVGGGKG